MRVDIWSDVVCPWCYIGKRRFETALSGFAHSEQVEVVWHSFQLDPTTVSDPAGAAPAVSHSRRLADKFGRSVAEIDAMQANLSALAAAEGLDYHLDDVRSANTFDAHRLLHLAADRGLQGELKERLLRATFVDTEAVGDHATLQRLATEVGLPADEVAAVLASDRYADDVRADVDQAREYGITGVPFFVVDAKYGISGAQPAEVLSGALDQAWAEHAQV